MSQLSPSFCCVTLDRTIARNCACGSVYSNNNINSTTANTDIRQQPCWTLVSQCFNVARFVIILQGNFLLSGSSDKSAIVWDVARGDVQQQFRFHEAPTLVSLMVACCTGLPSVSLIFLPFSLFVVLVVFVADRLLSHLSA